METIILEDFPFTVPAEGIMKRLRLRPGDEDAPMVERMCGDFAERARPRAVCVLVPVERMEGDSVRVGGVRVDSRLVAVNLQAVNRAAPYVATCGVEAEALSQDYPDFYESYCAEVIKEHLVHVAASYAADYVGRRYYAGERLSRMSPGSLKEWPLTAQREVFAMLGDVERDVGVTLTESCLMLPHKSVSGILFSSKEGYVNCAMCPILSCPNRQAPYDETLYARKYAQ